MTTVDIDQYLHICQYKISEDCEISSKEKMSANMCKNCRRKYQSEYRLKYYHEVIKKKRQMEREKPQDICAETPAIPKRKVGRPRKNSEDSITKKESIQSISPSTEPTKKRIGRPRKFDPFNVKDSDVRIVTTVV